MPYQLSQRPMTEAERDALRAFRERPSFIGFVLRSLIPGVIAGGILGFFAFLSMRDGKQGSTDARDIGVAVGTVIALCILVLASVTEHAARRTRRRERNTTADIGIVNVADITLDRAWTDGAGFHTLGYAWLEASPSLLARVRLDAKRLGRPDGGFQGRAGQWPAPLHEGQQVTERLIIETVPGPESSDVLLSSRWLGNTLEVHDEVPDWVGRYAAYQYYSSLLWAVKWLRGPWNATSNLALCGPTTRMRAMTDEEKGAIRQQSANVGCIVKAWLCVCGVGLLAAGIGYMVEKLFGWGFASGLSIGCALVLLMSAIAALAYRDERVQVKARRERMRNLRERGIICETTLELSRYWLMQGPKRSHVVVESQPFVSAPIPVREESDIPTSVVPLKSELKRRLTLCHACFEDDSIEDWELVGVNWSGEPLECAGEVERSVVPDHFGLDYFEPEVEMSSFASLAAFVARYQWCHSASNDVSG